MRFERKRGCNLAESFEGIWEFIARTNILVPPPASSRRNVGINYKEHSTKYKTWVKN
jgi:hypothetical protein